MRPTTPRGGRSGPGPSKTKKPGKFAGKGPSDRLPQGPSQRQLKAGELIRHALAEVLRESEVADPALKGVSVTVSEVRMSPDLRHATVFAQPLGGEKSDDVIAALNRISRFLRGRIGHMTALKFTPDLNFRHDESFETAAHMDELFSKPEVQRDLVHPDDEERRSGRAPEGLRGQLDWDVARRAIRSTAGSASTSLWASAPPAPSARCGRSSRRRRRATPARSTPWPRASCPSRWARRPRPCLSPPTPRRPTASPCAGGWRPPRWILEGDVVGHLGCPPDVGGRYSEALKAFVGEIEQVPPDLFRHQGRRRARLRPGSRRGDAGAGRPQGDHPRRARGRGARRRPPHRRDRLRQGNLRPRPRPRSGRQTRDRGARHGPQTHPRGVILRGFRHTPGNFRRSRA